MINTLISTLLGAILYGAAISHLHHVMQIYNKIQIKFDRQKAKLITRHLIGKDLFTAAISAEKLEVQNLMPSSDILILHTMQQDITYYLRKSTIQTHKQTTKYALYRDDNIHHALAIVENISAVRVQILPLASNRQHVKVTVVFDSDDIMEIACTLPH